MTIATSFFKLPAFKALSCDLNEPLISSEEQLIDEILTFLQILNSVERVIFNPIYILNSSRHVYQTSISRRLHFMMLAKLGGRIG